MFKNMVGRNKVNVSDEMVVKKFFRIKNPNGLVWFGATANGPGKKISFIRMVERKMIFNQANKRQRGEGSLPFGNN